MCNTDILEQFKQMFWALIMGVVSVFISLIPILILLAIVFLRNIWVGIKADKVVNSKPFNLEKSFKALSQLLFYFAGIILVGIASVVYNEPAVADIGAKGVSCIVIYFYVTNIYKNKILIDPKDKAAQFLYELLTTEIYGRLKGVFGFKSD